MPAKKRSEDAPPNTLGWMVTFSDMTTLLLTFFVLLLSMCSLEAGKIKQIQRTTLDAMGVLFEGEKSDVGVKIILKGEESVLYKGERAEVGVRTIVTAKEMIKEAVSVTKHVSKSYARLKLKLVREHLLGTVEFEETEKGFNILLRNELLFSSGKLEINPEGALVLNKIGEIIKDTKTDIIVEGHTDDIPISTERFPSNWELSTARAVSVVRYLTEEVGVNPMKFSAVGYGDTKPRVLNDTPENRCKNRRVRIVLVPQII